MADSNLRETMERQFPGLKIDPQSNGGQILSSLKPRPPFGGMDSIGKADAGQLSLMPTPNGVVVSAATGSDAFVLSLPLGPFDFRIISSNPPRVEVTLLPIELPLPFLFAAERDANGMLDVITGTKVEFRLTDLLLVITASEDQPASAELRPAENAKGKQTVTMNPALACFDSEGVLGFGFTAAKIDFSAVTQIKIDELEVFINPPGMPALALHGTSSSHTSPSRELLFDLQPGGGFTGGIELRNVDVSAQRPRFLRDLAALAQFNQNALTLLQITGTVDISKEVNLHVPGGGAPSQDLTFSLRLALNNDWDTSLTLTGDNDSYLWRVASTSGVQAALLKLVGAYAVFTPLLGGQSEPLGDTGLFVLSDLSAAGLPSSSIMDTRAITLYGGELRLKRSGPQYFGILFLDIETEFDLTIEVGIRIKTKKPIKVRHKAIGLSLDFGSGSTPELRPIFDPASGFTLDLSDPGLFNLPAPLDDILQTDGTRIARENPIVLEVDLIPKLNLGVITLDRAGLRVPLDPPGSPTITALGAHLHAGLVTGGGYLRLPREGEREAELAGNLDLSLLALGVRIRASLRLAEKQQGTRSFLGVFAALQVNWPIPIPLGGSGLGLMGLVGAFAMHMAPGQEENESALEWLHRHPKGVDDERVWDGKLDHWAFGAGAVIGTLEGGFIVNAKGLVMLELPGPRVLIFMKADILKKPPEITGSDRGSFVAVVDLGPKIFSIGILLDYNELKPLLQVRVPVEATFNRTDGKDWRVDIGALPPKLPAKVKFLSSFEADGYLLMHGNGIPAMADPGPPSQEDFPIGPLHGFAIAVGVRIAFTWGPVEIGLFLRITFRADIGVSFKPLMLAGRAGIKGELHLFMVGVSVSAWAAVKISGDQYFIEAVVCGSVDLFLFEVSKCVTLSFGEDFNFVKPELMLRAVSLHARPPALLIGSGATEQPIDGSLGNASVSGESMPVVPIDAFPVLQFEMCPGVEPGCNFLGVPVQSLLPSQPPGAPFDPKLLPEQAWLRRGPRFYHYRLKFIRLDGMKGGVPLVELVTTGEKPCVWWDRTGRHLRGADNEVQLALLNWNAIPTPVAAERSETHTTDITTQIGNICAEIAHEAAVLWSFVKTHGGIATDGWWLKGIAARDKSGTVRSALPDTRLLVTEPWRSGDALADSLVAVEPAYVSGILHRKGNLLISPLTGTKLEPRDIDPELIKLMAQNPILDLDGLANAIRLETSGLKSMRLLLRMTQDLWETQTFALHGFHKGSVTPAVHIIFPSSDPQIIRQQIIRQKEDLPETWLTEELWQPTVDALWETWKHAEEEFKDVQSFILIELEFDEVVTEIKIGVEADVEEQWRLLLIEGITEAEFFRAAFDNTARNEQIKRVEGALNNDPSRRALLKAGATYTLTVGYDVSVTIPDEQDRPSLKDDDLKVETGLKQSFQFQTEAEPPTRLDPWVLATSPAPRQTSFFRKDDVIIVFSTPATRKLFAGYERKLVAVVRAASGRHPKDQTDFDAANVSKTISGIVLTPFASAVSGISCITFTGGGTVHEQNTFRLDLEPQTDYILDVTAESIDGLPIDPPPDPLTPLYRLSFTTSQYESHQALAADILNRAVEHRWLEETGPLAALARGSGEVIISDLALENALRQVKWGDLRRTDVPRVTVIWKKGSDVPYVPFGVLMDAPEPVWRSRDVPAIFTTAGISRYRLEPKPWLELKEMSSGNLVTHFIHATDGARTLLRLDPNALGATLEVGLRRIHHVLFEGGQQPPIIALLRTELTSPPWQGGT